MDDLIARLRAEIDEDERVLEELERQLANDGEQMEGGWSLWGRFGQLADRFVKPKRWRAQVATNRAFLEYLEHELHDDATQEWLLYLLRSLADSYGINTPTR